MILLILAIHVLKMIKFGRFIELQSKTSCKIFWAHSVFFLLLTCTCYSTIYPLHAVMRLICMVIVNFLLA